MKKTPKKVVAKAIPKTGYKADIIVLGRKYSAKGKTISEAINALKIGVARGKAILTIFGAKQSKERVLSPMQTARLFNTRGLSQEVVLKNVSSLFDGI